MFTNFLISKIYYHSLTRKMMVSWKVGFISKTEHSHGCHGRIWENRLAMAVADDDDDDDTHMVSNLLMSLK